jgi:hypothetical protein
LHATSVRSYDENKVFGGTRGRVQLRDIADYLPAPALKETLIELLQNYAIEIPGVNYQFLPQEEFECHSVTCYSFVVPICDPQLESGKCYATPTYQERSRYDCIQVAGEDGSWYGKLRLLFAWCDYAGQVHHLALVKNFDFVDDNNPVCVTFQQPWVQTSSVHSLIPVGAIEQFVFLRKDFTGSHMYYVCH